MEVVEQRLRKLHISVQFTPALKKHLADVGYDPAFGARPLKRAIQDQVLDELALELIEKKIETGAEVKVDVKDGKIIFVQAN